MNLINKIPIPENYITDTEFLEEYNECFDRYDNGMINGSIYTLKDGFEFEGWAKLIPSGKYNFSYKQNFIPYFYPLVTWKLKSNKYYLFYDWDNNFELNYISEESFKGYRTDLIIDQKYTAVSVSETGIGSSVKFYRFKYSEDLIGSMGIIMPI